MSINRRYEILLPVVFNDGAIVPESLFTQTLLELRTRFGTVSCEAQAIHGIRPEGNGVARDKLIRVFIDVPGTPADIQFFRDYKERLKSRFHQQHIWITNHPLEVV